MPLVDDHHRPNNPHDVAERALDDRAHLRPRLRLARPHRRIHIQVGHLRQQFPVSLDVVLARQEAQHVAAVAEELERFLALPRG